MQSGRPVLQAIFATRENGKPVLAIVGFVLGPDGDLRPQGSFIDGSDNRGPRIIYAGQQRKGTGLPAQYGSQMNQVPDAALSLGPAILEQVPNPLSGVVQAGTLAQRTVQRGHLLRPFPQFTGLSLEGFPIGHSVYHSLQFKVTRRFGSSLIGAAYTVSKGIGNTESRSDWLEAGAQNALMGFLNNNNRRLDRSLNLFDNPQRLAISYTLDLPFGKGQRLLNNRGPAGWIVSGWQMTGVYIAESGTPLALTAVSNLTGSFGGGSRPNNNGQSAKLKGDSRERLNRWFYNSTFNQPAAFTYGNTGRTLPDVRNHATNNLDAGFFKNNRLGSDGRFKVQFRGEFFNVLNRVRFGNPGLAFGSP